MTDAELASIEEWFAHTTPPCVNDVCVGEWGQVNGPLLIAEVKRLRALLRQHGIAPGGKGEPYEPEPYGPPVAWVDDGKGPRAIARFHGVEGE